MHSAKQISNSGLAIIVVSLLTACQQTEIRDAAALNNAGGRAGAVDDRPNILFIMADDLGYSDVGFFGSEIRTPNLDELARDGLRLSNFHAAPICALTRAMLMSGTTSGEAGVGGLDDPLRADVAALPERLTAAGYHTYMAGKWNLGVAVEDGPAARGFESSYTLMKAGDNHLGQNLYPGSPPVYDGHPVYLENGEPVALPEDWFSSRIYTDKLMQYIGGNAGDGVPWFGYLAFTAPHWPLQVPEDWIDKYSGNYDAGYNELQKARFQEAKRQGIFTEALGLDGLIAAADSWDTLDAQERRIQIRSMEVYAAMVENMDMHVGRLIEFLDAAEQLENTVIVFSSDNGAARETREFRPTTIPRTDTDNSLENIGREGSFAALGPGWAQAAMAPYRGLKGSLYEGGTLVPAFINNAELADKGDIDHTYLTIMDLLPTFLDIAGQSVNGTEFQGHEVLPVRGNSFWDSVTGNSDRVRDSDDAVVWAVPTAGTLPQTTALVQWPWKLYGERSDDPELGLRWALFNLETDPGERRDVAGEHPAITSELAAVWDASEIQ
jgi:arylsulfatase A-like enzyme